ncbi:hypothetical protein J6590_101038, partial [Homalodisca vitripennis]
MPRNFNLKGSERDRLGHRDTGPLHRSHPPTNSTPAAPRRPSGHDMATPAGWDTSSRRALKRTVHKTAQKLLTHESMGASTLKMLAARCGAGR